MSTKPMHFLLKRAPLLTAALFAVLLSVFTAAPASAQQTEISPEHLAMARKYVELTDKSGIFEVALLETAVQTMRTIMSANPDILDPIDAATKKVLDAYKPRKSELMDQFARVYALNFSLEELTEIVAFYESPVGAKLATANATLNESLVRVMQVFEANLKTEFFAQVRAELKAAGFDV